MPVRHLIIELLVLLVEPLAESPSVAERPVVGGARVALVETRVEVAVSRVRLLHARSVHRCNKNFSKESNENNLNVGVTSPPTASCSDCSQKNLALATRGSTIIIITARIFAFVKNIALNLNCVLEIRGCVCAYVYIEVRVRPSGCNLSNNELVDFGLHCGQCSLSMWFDNDDAAGCKDRCNRRRREEESTVCKQPQYMYNTSEYIY